MENRVLDCVRLVLEILLRVHLLDSISFSNSLRELLRSDELSARSDRFQRYITTVASSKSYCNLPDLIHLTWIFVSQYLKPTQQRFLLYYGLSLPNSTATTTTTTNRHGSDIPSLTYCPAFS